MSRLPYIYWCNHLTEVDCKWRRVDYDARAFVRGLKQEDFKGYLDIRFAGKNRRFDQTNVEEFIATILPLIGKRLRDDIQAPISLVPIPNSGMAQGYSGPFRTVELATLVAKGFGEGASVVEAIVWDLPRNKAHQSHEFRHPDLYEPHMVLVDKPAAKIVLFDDVLTSGSQMIAAARMLAKQGVPPECALVIARATKEQAEGKLFARRQDELDLSDDPFDFDQL